MKTLKILLLLGAVGGGYQYWQGHRQEVAAGPMVSNNGFVRIPEVGGAKPDTVLVIAAQNCPHEDAQRADGLAQDLAAKGISVERTHNVSFVMQSTDTPEAKNLPGIMNGPLPVVIVDGRAKSNPTLDEVIAEVKRGSR